MTTSTSSQREHLAGMLKERKHVMREEIRAGLLRMRVDGYEDLLSGTSDVADESVASLLTDLNNADVARDATELQDILAAEGRLAAGTFAVCVDCAKPIPYARLIAHPTAKRCLECQQIHEANRPHAARS